MLAFLPDPLAAGSVPQPADGLVFDLTLTRATLALSDTPRDPALRTRDVATAGLQDRFTFLGLRVGETVAARFDVDAREAGGHGGLTLALPRRPALRSTIFRRACGAFVIDGYPGYSFTLDPAQAVARHETDDVIHFVHGGEHHTSSGNTFHLALSNLAVAAPVA